jgi:hypothetical protein
MTTQQKNLEFIVALMPINRKLQYVKLSDFDKFSE